MHWDSQPKPFAMRGCFLDCMAHIYIVYLYKNTEERMKQVHTIRIESGCDDTSIALVDKGLLKANAGAIKKLIIWWGSA